jgi:hypothetical protein
MHELFGSSPSNFELVDVEGEIGCFSRKSLVKCNKKLFWYWTDGIYEYNGSSPVKISQPVDDYISFVVDISGLEGSTEYRIFVEAYEA